MKDTRRRKRAFFVACWLAACGARTELNRGTDDHAATTTIRDAGAVRRDAAVTCDEGGSGTLCPTAEGARTCVDTTRDTANCGGCNVHCDVVQACANGACVPIASQLTGLRWELPCLTDPGPSRDSCRTPGVATKTATIGGAPGATYLVQMRFRGVVETEGYAGGTDDGAFFQIGGAPIMDSWNIYKLEISSPPQTYFLNRGQGGLYYCFGIDYSKTVQMTAGATVTLTADPVDGAREEIVNVDENGSPIVAAGVPPAPAPFNGQFIQVDVTGVEEQ